MSGTLAETNPFVRTAADRRREVFESVASSSAIEGIRAPFRASGAVAGEFRVARAARNVRAITAAKIAPIGA